MASLHLGPQVNGFNKEHKLLPGSSSSYSSSWLYLQTSLPQWKHQNHPFKIRSSVFNSLQNQTQRNISNLQEDITLGDPLCGFSVLQEQTAELEEEAKNVFREVLEGLARLFVQYCCWEKCIRNPWIWAINCGVYIHDKGGLPTYNEWFGIRRRGIQCAGGLSVWANDGKRCHGDDTTSHYNIYGGNEVLLKGTKYKWRCR